MPALTMEPRFSIQVDLAELRLILKALGGRLKPDDVLAAAALGDILTSQRSVALRRTADQLDSALSAIDKERSGE